MEKVGIMTISVKVKVPVTRDDKSCDEIAKNVMENAPAKLKQVIKDCLEVSGENEGDVEVFL